MIHLVDFMLCIFHHNKKRKHNHKKNQQVQIIVNELAADSIVFDCKCWGGFQRQRVGVPAEMLWAIWILPKGGVGEESSGVKPALVGGCLSESQGSTTKDHAAQVFSFPGASGKREMSRG